ncbi:hypothetical protein HBI56_069460 [Parastagonospora nodorum]|uniref:Uncharacterized protein n=1 Tax=Phaeosphaeria nodorum (strain SN15 / ATCC MYA-4574 / FGSC 10173) TaxID=321614 RepID=A0A7U2ESG7_PHANO|nr:hypothetical protein HBH56_003900 [Parastagonospora nodorum]QRC90304.1 hypothetical protein JI435_400340 [Parastagonospora nodorum SN15]KAH3938150.1 hypothetical protein HBH54_003890 [Parastagonospora nodorum]KAH3946634.1 hypothetical protein HBH53_128090 [Parastagonospora nodorum]KAH3974988.1 hypothetical protein HBH51_086660 [Parastagonospora nodorum]
MVIGRLYCRPSRLAFGLSTLRPTVRTSREESRPHISTLSSIPPFLRVTSTSVKRRHGVQRKFQGRSTLRWDVPVSEQVSDITFLARPGLAQNSAHGSPTNAPER